MPIELSQILVENQSLEKRAFQNLGKYEKQ
jgi:hypothetical protein